MSPRQIEIPESWLSLNVLGSVSVHYHIKVVPYTYSTAESAGLLFMATPVQPAADASARRVPGECRGSATVGIRVACQRPTSGMKDGERSRGRDRSRVRLRHLEHRNT